MIIWSYYYVDADEHSYLADLETGVDIMPRKAWTTKDAAMAAAEDDAREAWKDYQDAVFVEGDKDDVICRCGGRLPHAPEAGCPGVAMTPLEWRLNDNGMTEAGDADDAGGTFVVYKIELVGQ